MTLNESTLKDGLSTFATFLAYHKNQLELSNVPKHFWESLHKKLCGNIFDAGDTFSVLKFEYESRNGHEPLYRVQVNCDVFPNDPLHIYLIDHAWTFSATAAKQHLLEIPGLAERMASLMGISTQNMTPMEVNDAVFDEMWMYNQTYSVSGLSIDNIEDRMPVWYIMDEFGSAIQHSDDPNFRTVPLIYLPEQVTYTLLFPIRNTLRGEDVTRDFIEGQNKDPLLRRALLLPWLPYSFQSFDFKQVEPDEEYFLDGHIRESLPTLENGRLNDLTIENSFTLRVYSEYKYVNQYLSHPRFEIVDSESDADILWYTKHFKAYQELSDHYPWKFVNQFPFENVITIKDLLSIISRRNFQDTHDPDSLDTFPTWLPTTYNMKNELVQFVSYYQHRSEKKLDNHWIIKPWNLARGLDTHITSNLNYILKLFFTGPKIAQKYIENPILFERPEIGPVKFDIRYVILLKSVSPLKVYVYRNFFLRFANHRFELSDFDDYEKHFTVMNYQSSTPLYRLLCHEFIQEFEKQYADVTWKDVEKSIFTMISEVFVSATSVEPPRGIGHSPQSRALYAADIMLEKKHDPVNKTLSVMQPKLLEINWTPDCKRACDYYPQFYNDIFSLLFLNEFNEKLFEELGTHS